MPQPRYATQENRGYGGNTSLEETWMDLVNILELPSNDSAGMVNNMNGPGRMMTPQNHSNALIQNVTMPTPINNTVNTNSFEPRKHPNLSNMVSLWHSQKKIIKDSFDNVSDNIEFV